MQACQSKPPTRPRTGSLTGGRTPSPPLHARSWDGRRPCTVRIRYYRTGIGRSIGMHEMRRPSVIIMNVGCAKLPRGWHPSRERGPCMPQVSHYAGCGARLVVLIKVACHRDSSSSAACEYGSTVSDCAMCADLCPLLANIVPHTTGQSARWLRRIAILRA